MKIKTKKPFGEKHRLRRANQDIRREKQNEMRHLHRDRRLRQLEEYKHKAFAQYQAFMERYPWYRRILELRPEEACEFYAHPEWRAASFAQVLKCGRKNVLVVRLDVTHTFRF